MFGKGKETFTMFASAKRAIRCWLTDGVHDAEDFEDALKATFGANTCLFGNPGSAISGSKFAVTTASISDATPFILSNYNGTVSKNRYLGKQFRHFPHIYYLIVNRL
jgi:hypothetical protein